MNDLDLNAGDFNGLAELAEPDQGSGPTYFTADVEVLGPESDEAGIDHVDVEYL